MNENLINIVVCYANEQEVVQYAKSLSSQSVSSSVKLVVVVNKSGIDSYEFEKELRKIQMNIEVHYPNKNLGYLNGLIYGYKCYLDKNEKPDWVIMSNTDIEFIDHHFLENFLISEYSDNTVCVAPSVFVPRNRSYENPQYTERHSLSSINRRIFIFQRPILAYIYIKLSNFKAKITKKSKSESQYVYSAHGCFFMIRNVLADKLSETGYKSLMYSEEAFVAETILQLGKKCFYDSSIEIIHNENSVTGMLGIKKKAQYYVDSLNSIKKEFY